MNKKYLKPLSCIVIFGALLFVLLKAPMISCQKYISPSMGQLQLAGVSIECKLKVLEIKINYPSSGSYNSLKDTNTSYDTSLWDLWIVNTKNK